MPLQAKPAVLAACVHGLALLLAWAGWHAAPAVPLPAQHGLQVTTVALGPAKTDAPQTEARTKPKAVREQPRITETTPQARPVLANTAPPPLHDPLSERDMAKPVAIAVTAASGSADNGEGTPASPPATTASDEAPRPASAAPSGEAMPARPAKGADSYALRVFRHIREVKEFPAHLARTGIHGRVLVRFDITPNGEATGIAVARSSGVTALDVLALEQIRAAVPYPRPPRQLQAVHLHFIVPMTYRPSS